MTNILKDLELLTTTSLTSPSEVDFSGQKLEKLVLPSVDEMATEQQEKVVEGLTRAGGLSKLQALYEVYETNLENKFVEAFIRSGTASVESYRMYARFLSLIKHEIELANIETGDRVAFIGSGPLPITAVLLNQLSGCSVDCYEHYLPAALVSRKFIQHLNLEEQVSVFYQPGQHINAKAYTTVIIALLAKPKKLILGQIAKTTSLDISIICRTSDYLRQVFYETTLPADFAGYRTVEKKAAHGDETISSVRLTVQ